MRRTLAVLATLLVMAATAPAQAREPEPVRIMLVGDSTTQGLSGDWTWRYRLWKHLESGATPVDFVGPNTDLFDMRTQTFGSHDYADPAFDQDHAARFSAATITPPAPVAQLVEDYAPDIMVVLLGVNDLVGFAGTAQHVVEGLRIVIEQARAVRPDLTVVLGTLPWIWIEGTQAVNDALPALAAAMSTSTSPVRVADFGAFTECEQTHDRVHLSARGEQQVAAGFADALAGLGVGGAYQRPLAPVPDVPRQTATLTARPANRAVWLEWTRPAGATHQVLWVRDQTAGSAWSALPWFIVEDGYTIRGLRNGHDYEFRVQSGTGCRNSDLFSAVVTAQPRNPDLTRLTARSTRRGVRVFWNPVLSATTYRVAWGNGRSRLIGGTRVVLRRLRPDKTYRIRVSVPKMPGVSLTTTATPRRTNRARQ